MSKRSPINSLLIPILMFALPPVAEAEELLYSPGQILVKFRTPASKPSQDQLQDLARRFVAQPPEPLFPDPPRLSKPVRNFHQVYRIRIRPDVDPREASVAYAALREVAYAQPNHLFRPVQAPNDERFSEQTGLSNIHWQELWDRLGPKQQEVVLAVIDSGIDTDHEDLAENIWTNRAEVEGQPGVDDDRNGYVDDVSGWDFSDAPDLPAKGDFLTRDNDPSDESGHGTLVAGIAAARADNGVGIAGVAPDAKLMALRGGVLLQAGGSFFEEDDLAAAILYAVENGADVINMSWGSSERAFLIQDAIRYASINGCVLVAAAGNEGESGLSYPAAFDETIAVAATDRNDLVASFSSRGSGLDLSAPGINILSTLPGDTYGFSSGTSFSAPHISGLAALLLSRRPELTADQVRSLLSAATVDLGPDGWDETFGAGRIDGLALLSPLSSPDAPATVQIRAPGADAGAESEFTVLASASGQEVTVYRISWGLGRSPSSWSPLDEGPSSSEIEVSWDVSSLPDTSAVLRLEADLEDGRTLEDRVPVFVRRSAPSITGIVIGQILDRDRRVYEVRWRTDQLTEGVVLFKPLDATEEDTLSLGFIDSTHTARLPQDLADGPLQIRVRSAGSSGKTVLSEPDTVTVSPLLVQREGFIKVTELPDGFLADRPSDFDGDGLAEIALMPYVEGQPFSPVQIYEQTAEGEFAQVFESSETFLPWSVGDVDNDGSPDLLGSELSRLRLFTGGPFPSTQVLQRTQTWGGEIADLDGDGKNEIIARSAVIPGIEVLEQASDGVIREVTSLFDPTSGSGDIGARFVIADLDGDGRNELLGGDADGDLWVFESDGDDSYRSTWKLEGDDDTDVRWVGGGVDLDGDGQIEFAAARASEDPTDPLNGFWDLEIYSASGDDAFALEWTTRITGVSTTGNGISAGDVDGDGTFDLAVCLLPDLYIFRSDGPDIYRPIWYSPAGLTHRPVIADLDGDDRTEILFNRDGAVQVLEWDAPSREVVSPEILSARPLGRDRVQLTWVKTPEASGYRLLRGTDAETLVALEEGLVVTAFIDTTVLEGQLYFYAIEAILGGENSVRSRSVSVRPDAPPQLIRLDPIENRLHITFNQPMAPEAADPDRYSVLPGVGRPESAILDQAGTRIVLSFPVPFIDGTDYTLLIGDATDTSGVPLDTPSQTTPFAPGRSVYPAASIADFDDDGFVGFLDFVLFALAFEGADPDFDLDEDGAVAFSDFLLFALMFGQTI